MRPIVSCASIVCIVESTRWPGLAGLEGDARRLLVAQLADQDHVGVLTQDAPHALVEGVDVEPDLTLLHDELRSAWTISIGSSSVTMCWRRVVLTWSIIAASVVVLPEPVAPVTRTRPRCSSASALHARREAERCRSVGTSAGT